MVKQTEKFKQRRAESRTSTQFSSAYQPPRHDGHLRYILRFMLAQEIDISLDALHLLDRLGVLKKMIGRSPNVTEQIAFEMIKKALQGDLKAVDKIIMITET